MIERAAFVERFLLPLVEGGDVHVSAPLGFSALSAFELEDDDSAAERGLSSARWAVARELLCDAEPPSLDEESLRIAIASHDLLFLAHPEGPELARGEGHRRVAAGCVALVAGLPASAEATELVARHTLLHRLTQAVRLDVRVSFWAGRRDFRGQAPPPRLTAWPRLRRVSEERSQVGCLAEAATDASGGADAARTLLRASPLTDLLNPLRTEPPFDLAGWEKIEAALGNQDVCRLVAYRWLEQGVVRCGGAFAAALIARLGSRARDDLRRGLALLSHLHLCLVVGDGQVRARALGAGPPDEARLADFCGLFAALHQAAPALCLPADVLSDPALRARCAAHAAACALACSPARLQELRALCARAVDARDDRAA